MANVINLNDHIKDKSDELLLTKIKLCRIRDDIEEKLNKISIVENDELAVSLSGRYSLWNQLVIRQRRQYNFFMIALKLPVRLDLRNQ